MNSSITDTNSNSQSISSDSTLTSLQSAFKTDIGKKREENQDSGVIFDGPNYRMYIVCDGMGGVKGGAIASSLAIDVIKQSLLPLVDPGQSAIVRAVQQANERIFEEGVTKTVLAGMGTTFVGLLFADSKLLVSSVGDSRAYRFRSTKDITQLTEDHTLVMELIRSGTITPEQAHNHPVSHMLTRSLGPSPEVDVDCYICRDGPARGDIYLLCSDGLYNLVTEEEMAEIVINSEVDQSVTKLVDLANERGGTDNITVIVIKVGDKFPVGLEDIPEVAASSHVFAEQIRPLVSKTVASPSDQNQTFASATSTRAAYQQANISQPETNVNHEVRESTTLPARATEPDDGLSKTPRLESKIDIADSHSVFRSSEDSSRYQDSYQQQRSGERAGYSQQEQNTQQSRVDSGKTYTDSVNSNSTNSTNLNSAALNSEVARKNLHGSLANIALVLTCIAIFFLVIRVVSRSGDTQSAKNIEIKLNSEIKDKIDQSAQSSEAHNLDRATGDATGIDDRKVSIDAETISNLGKSQKEQIIRRRELLRARLADIAEKINSFDKPLSGSAGKTLAESAARLQETQNRLDEVRSKIDVATRKLTVWYGRRKRLQETDPVNLANEVSVSSDEVRIKKDQFEKTTWTYLREAEGLIYNPNDQTQEQKVAELVKLRKQHMTELVDAIRRAIDQSASEANQHVAELTLDRDALQAGLETAKLDQLYAKILLGSDQSAKDRILEQLKRERSIVQAELDGLEQLANSSEKINDSILNPAEAKLE